MWLALLPLALAETYALADAGVTLDLPGGWEMTRWSDWDFKGRSPDGGVALELWTTPWQVPPTMDAAKGFAALHRGKLDEMRAEDVQMKRASAENVGGRDVARVDLAFAFEKKGPKGVAYAASFPVEGKVVHVLTLAAAPNAAKAERALETVLQRLTVQKAPPDLDALAGALKTDLGFAATLPPGWRAPLPAERDGVADAVGSVGPKDPAACATAVKPLPAGNADVMLLCREAWALGIVSEPSFRDEEKLLKDRLFGKAADKLAPADPIVTKDRTGFLLRPIVPDRDLRMAVVPYDRGTVVGWAAGPEGEAAYLEEALRATVTGLAYEGPDGGVPQHDVGATVVHTLTYDPFHPGVLLCGGAAIATMGGLLWIALRPKKKVEEQHHYGP